VHKVALSIPVLRQLLALVGACDADKPTLMAKLSKVGQAMGQSRPTIIVVGAFVSSSKTAAPRSSLPGLLDSRLFV